MDNKEGWQGQMAPLEDGLPSASPAASSALMLMMVIMVTQMDTG